MKSTMGYIIYLNGSPISWKSKVHTDHPMSTAEAEYVAMSACTAEVIYLQGLLTEMGFTQKSTQLFVDNTAAIALTKGDVAHSRTRHIRLRWHFIRAEVDRGTITVSHCRSEHLPADELTKALPQDQHEYLRSKLCGKGISESTNGHNHSVTASP